MLRNMKVKMLLIVVSLMLLLTLSSCYDVSGNPLDINGNPVTPKPFPVSMSTNITISEVDPVFGASVAHSIESSNITNWDNKLNSANVTTTNTAGLVPAADANKTVDSWVSKIVYIKCLAETTALATGNGSAYFTVPLELNGMNLVAVAASVYTVSSSGLPTFMVYNSTDNTSMLSTALTIDASELTSYTAATAAVINTSYDDVSQGDQIRIDCSTAGTGTKGCDLILTFRKA